MRRLLYRAGYLVSVVVAVTLLAFVLLGGLPGDAALGLLGANADAASVAALRAELGLDRPLPHRYLEWLGQALRGDLGRSLVTGQDVTALIGSRLPVSLQLMLMAQLVALSLAIPLALFGSASHRKGADFLTQGASLVLLSAPAYVLGLLLAWLFGVQLQWLPVTGFQPLGLGLADNLRHMVLPALTVGLAEFPVYYRVLRGDLRQTLRQPFVVFARARGVPERRILTHHVLKPASLSLLTLVGLSVASTIGGAVIVENLFALPGVGRLLVQSVEQRDFPVLQGIVILVAIGYVLVHALVDAGYALLDPRLRRGGVSGSVYRAV